MGLRAFQGVLGIKNPPANSGDLRDLCFFPGSGRSLGGGHSNPLQYFCLENPMDGGPWWATVHGVTKSQTRLRRLSMHTHMGLKSKSFFVIRSRDQKRGAYC